MPTSKQRVIFYYPQNDELIDLTESLENLPEGYTTLQDIYDGCKAHEQFLTSLFTETTDIHASFIEEQRLFAMSLRIFVSQIRTRSLILAGVTVKP